MSYEAPHYAVFPSLFHFISLRSKYSPQTPSVYVPPLMSETKSHKYTEPKDTGLNDSKYFHFLTNKGRLNLELGKYTSMNYAN
jgi:hypothetical protein